MSYDELVESINADLDALGAPHCNAAQLADENGTMICFSCLQPRTEDELGECLECGSRICGIGSCTGVCLCALVEENASE